MSDSRGKPRPWTLSWVHLVLALAVGAGLPVAWMWFAAPAEAVVVADAGAAATGAEGAPAPAAPTAGTAGTAAALAEPAAVATPARTAQLPPSPPMPPVPPRPQIPRVRDPNGDQTPDVTDFINAGEVPTMAEVISRLQAAGVRSGLAAFNAPGTRPPLVGVAVADDVELPPGFVRHHQFTDDGRRIEPILMFSPEHPLVAAMGLDATRPQDRVVPAALVPPGMPVRQIVVPPASSGSEPANEPRK
ncbi:MAG: hypothetical protein JNL85_18475 [Rubrivivax sp.]|nr:hypothetical protein [Rubrivivax sp.]